MKKEKALIILLVFFLILPQQVSADLHFGIISAIQKKINELEEKKEEKYEYPQFIQHDYIELGKIKAISKFRSGVGHDYSDDFESNRSMKHYFFPKDGIDWTSIIIYSPVDGTIDRIFEEWAGKQVWIKVKNYPSFIIRIFHINLVSSLHTGSYVTCGQQLGHHIGSQTYSDIAIAQHIGSRIKLISYFEVMEDAVFMDYQIRGVDSRDEMIISKEYRDKNPPDWGSYDPNDWVILN